MKKIRVMVVDDSAFMRKVISDIVSKTSFLEIAGTARDGNDALVKIKELKPDVVTMDVEMPGMDGIEAVGKIMKEQPTPIVMLSSLTHEGAEATVAALANGAVDFIPKPGPSISLNMHEIENELIEKILIASKINVARLKTNVRYTELPTQKKAEKIEQTSKPSLARTILGKQDFTIVLIGTSTGGPKALHEVVSRIDIASSAAAFLIVQHMPAGFTASLAARLNRLTDYTVKEAEDGEAISPGNIYIAPGGFQMEINAQGDKNRLNLKVHKGEQVTGHRPSVDALFLSAARKNYPKTVAVIMTGMGHDGMRGMIELKKNNCITIGEAEETCVVYGMPKSAIEAGCVDKVVPLEKIANEIKVAVNSMP